MTMPAGNTPVDTDELAAAIRDVCRVMNFHGGAIELLGVGEDGVVNIEFVGMCKGCPIRPVTLYGTILPRIEQVSGVTDVRARGVRISDEAARSLVSALVEQ